MAAAIREAQDYVHVEFYILQSDATTESFFAAMEGFLGTCLGGRVQPIGDSFEGSSAEILAGAEYVGQLWLFWVAPILGAMVAGAVTRMLYEPADPVDTVVVDQRKAA